MSRYPQEPETAQNASLTYLAFHAARNQEESAAPRDGQGNAKVLPGVLLTHDQDAPDHDGDHLGTFAQRLNWKGHVLECLVLAGGGNHVRQGHRGVGVQGSYRLDLAHLAIRLGRHERTAHTKIRVGGGGKGKGST